MSDLLAPGAQIDIASLPMTHEPLPADQVVSGAPTTATHVVSEGAAKVGIWEMTTGVATDVEADELFVVISGRAHIEFLDDGTTLDVGPGSLVRLAAGMNTRWTITETLRKVYIL